MQFQRVHLCHQRERENILEGPMTVEGSVPQLVASGEAVYAQRKLEQMRIPPKFRTYSRKLNARLFLGT